MDIIYCKSFLIAFKNNEWTSNNPPILWGIYRNIPFAILGLLIIILFYNSTKKIKIKILKIYG